MTDVSLETCIERDRRRPNYVGEKVIRDMWERYLAPARPVIERNPNLPNAIICDLDGTLAHMTGRGPFEWSRVGEDRIDKAIQKIVFDLERTKILFLSGRDGVCQEATAKWLTDHGINNENLFMRPQGDTRPDEIVKREIYDREIQGKYNILFVLDDRSKVVRMWRGLGLKCLQVAEGDF